LTHRERFAYPARLFLKVGLLRKPETVTNPRAGAGGVLSLTGQVAIVEVRETDLALIGINQEKSHSIHSLFGLNGFFVVTFPGIVHLMRMLT
jgi:hypothetical protein